MVIITDECSGFLVTQQQQKQKLLNPALKDQVGKAVVHRAGNKCMNDSVNKLILLGTLITDF